LRQLARGTGQGKLTPCLVLLLADALGEENEEATALLRRMQLAQAHDFWVNFNLGNFLDAQEKHQEAAECYLVAVALRPDSVPAHNNLGYALKDKGKVDDAIACYRKAILLDPTFAWVHNNLGLALQAKGQVDKAIDCFRQAIRLDPKFAVAHAALAQAQQLLAADGKLQAFLAGKGAPADAVTQVQMADLAQQPYRRLYHAAARLYRDAFSGQPALASAHRYNAARAAALAGTSQGKDAARLNDAQRVEWRKPALDWLAADLAAYTALAKKADGRPSLRQQLTHWLKDTDLAGVRDEPALAKLPEKEREPWRKLWADVVDLLRKVEPK
jgi:tetratricopeptide (TPR) repeat protein